MDAVTKGLHKSLPQQKVLMCHLTLSWQEFAREMAGLGGQLETFLSCGFLLGADS